MTATRRVLDAQDGPVLLVGHSYGGAFITEAGTHDKVAALVYIAAFAPEVSGGLPVEAPTPRLSRVITRRLAAMPSTTRRAEGECARPTRKAEHSGVASVRRIERRVGIPRGCRGVVSDRVLIVGGGIAGLSSARALGRRDIAFVAVDRLGGAPDAGLALNLPGNAVRRWRALDLGDDIVGRGVPIRRREYRNARGRLLFAVDEAEFWGDAVTSVCVRRSHLLELLGAGVASGSVR